MCGGSLTGAPLGGAVEGRPGELGCGRGAGAGAGEGAGVGDGDGKGDGKGAGAGNGTGAGTGLGVTPGDVEADVIEFEPVFTTDPIGAQF